MVWGIVVGGNVGGWVVGGVKVIRRSWVLIFVMWGVGWENLGEGLLRVVN